MNGAAHEQAPVIAIDGPSGSGKGTIARRVAEELGWHLLDSGALYRLAAVAAERGPGIDAPEEELARVAREMNVRFGTAPGGDERIWLDGREVSGEVRSEDCGRRASQVAGKPAVREALLGLQRDFRRPPGLVADGRDMGTAVFPDAALKVFLTATPEKRAERRYKQLKEKNIDVSLAALSRDIAERDRQDSERSIAPLRAADDARLLDSSELTIEEVTRRVLLWVQEVMPASQREW